MSVLNLNLTNPAYTYLPSNGGLIGTNGWKDSATIYAGYTNSYTFDNQDGYIDLTGNARFVISSIMNKVKKISIKLKMSQSGNPKYTRLFLIKKEDNTGLSQKEALRANLSSNTVGYLATGNNNLEKSSYSSGTIVEYVIDGGDELLTLSPGTYYIYVVRKGTNQNGFTAFNMSSANMENAVAITYLKEFAITYDKGIGDANCPSNRTKTEGENFTLSANVPTKNDTTESNIFTITGNANGGSSTNNIIGIKKSTYSYKFSHWLGSDGNTYASGSTYTTDADITFTAQYTKTFKEDKYQNNTLDLLTKPTKATIEDGTHTVTLNSNGGNCDKSSLTSKDRTEYEFICWNSNQNGSGVDYTDSTSFTKDTTVYAKWRSIDRKESVTLPTPIKNNNIITNEFNIIGHANNGYFTLSNGAVSDENVVTATRTDTHEHKFSHWEDSNGNRYIGGSSYTPTSDITLTARYGDSIINTVYSNNEISKLKKPARDMVLDKTNTVTFDPNGGKCADSNLKSRDRTEYVFKHWSGQANGQGTIYTDNSKVYEETNLYAQWNAIDRKESITIPIATRDGYDFIGWGTSKDSISPNFIAGNVYTPDSSITLYAIWKARGLVNIGDLKVKPIVFCDGKWIDVLPGVFIDGKLNLSI